MQLNDIITWAVGILVVGLLAYVFYLVALKLKQIINIKPIVINDETKKQQEIKTLQDKLSKLQRGES